MSELVQNFYPETAEAPITEAPSVQYGPFTPILDRVLLKRIDEDKSKVGSFYVADKYKEISNKGVVLAVGEKVDTLKPGDVVLFGHYNADNFDKDGEELLVVWLGDIRGFERPL